MHGLVYHNIGAWVSLSQYWRNLVDRKFITILSCGLIYHNFSLVKSHNEYGGHNCDKLLVVRPHMILQFYWSRALEL